MNLEQVRAKVASQKAALPALYGHVTFAVTPERFTEDPRQSVMKHRHARLQIKPTREQIELIRAYTMLGDGVADAYAALIPVHGVRRLIEMLQRACDAGFAAQDAASGADGVYAQVELSRYRCFLLGLPEDLLADTPQKIVELMTARNETLRDGFDDATCGALIRATRRLTCRRTAR
jgi:hypothetical protein